MNTSILTLVNASKRERCSLIPHLTESDVSRIWDAISKVIKDNYVQRKATVIKNLGTFTYVTHRHVVAQKKALIIQRPVFVMGDKLVRTHRINQVQRPYTAEHTIMHLNYTSLALDVGIDRDSVELCVKEVVSAFNRAIASNTKVQFLFTGIGVLYVSNQRLKMKYFKEFLNLIDRTENIGNCMEQRPGTADSVMSMVSTLSALDRPDTSTFCLPKLNGSPSISKLPSIQESVLNEEQGDDEQEESARPGSAADDDDEISDDGDGRETLKPHQVVGFELVDEKPSDINFVDVEVPTKLPSPLPKSPKYAGSSRPSTAPQGLDLPASVGKLRSSTSTPRSRDHHLAPILPKCASPVCRNRSGHELCYLCMQRASRNVPVNFSEERKRKEMEQTALLQQYQQMKDADAIAREKEKENQNRNINRKVAAYNLGISEGIREERNRRNTEFEKSYVLRDRALTPSRRYHQHDYGQALETQVKIRKARQTREKHDRQFQEKLEQVQLAEDLVKQREQFLRAKAEQVSQYQQALSVQVKNKPLPIPAMEPDSEGPIFGRFDATNEKLWERKQRAQETLKKQLSMVADKKEKINNENVLKLKEESEMLKRTKEELIADRIGRHKRSLDLRKSLEDHWKVHQDNRLKRIQDERQSLKTPGLLLLQQTDHYKRCAQCKRGTLNHGESNIWRESRYIPGSRLMV